MDTRQYAISQYHDTREIYAKLEALVSQPLRPVKREKIQEFLSYFENQCKRSRAMTDEAKKYIPGGVQHNLAFNYPFPIAIEKPTVLICGTLMGTNILTFCKLAVPPCWAVIMRPCVKRFLNCCEIVVLLRVCSTNMN